LAVFAEEWRVAYYTTKTASQLCREPSWLLEVVLDEFLEHSKPVVELEKTNIRPIRLWL